jgi:Cell differentiation family, Rcd1-like
MVNESTVNCLRLETLLVQVGLLAEQPSVRLLKHIVRCYLRLSDNPRAREALRQCLPDLLRSPQFTACLKDDPTTCRCDALPCNAASQQLGEARALHTWRIQLQGLRRVKCGPRTCRWLAQLLINVGHAPDAALLAQDVLQPTAIQG